jgi:hypothetical protein
MKMVRSRILAALIVTTLGTQQVQAAKVQCITDAEMRSGISYFAPRLIESGVNGCARFLSKDDYMVAQGQRLLDEYKSQTTATSSDIEALIVKLSGTNSGLPKNVGIGAMTGMMDDLVRKELNANNCKTINRFMTDLGQMPASNMIGLIMTFVKVMTDDDRKKKARRTGKPIEPSPFCEN